MKEYFKYATLTIPAKTRLHLTTWEEIVIPIELHARAWISCYKDGRPKGANPVWLVHYNNGVVYLKVEQESQVTMEDVKIRRSDV